LVVVLKAYLSETSVGYPAVFSTAHVQEGAVQAWVVLGQLSELRGRERRGGFVFHRN
jgi:hypothetical protein